MRTNFVLIDAENVKPHLLEKTEHFSVGQKQVAKIVHLGLSRLHPAHS